MHVAVYGLGAPYRVLHFAKSIATDDYLVPLELTRGERGDAVHVELFEGDRWFGHDENLPVAVSNQIYF